MTIKEVSEKFGISQDTLRYYERVGLIPPVTRTPSGNRDYQESDLGWVENAVCMRNAGVLCKQGKDSSLVKIVPKLPGCDRLCPVRREVGKPPYPFPSQ